MGYSKELYHQVFSDLALSRQRAFTIAEQRREELFAAIPALRELEQEKSQLGITLSRQLIAHPEDSRQILSSFEKTSAQLLSHRDNLLSQAGISSDFLSPPFSCPHCEDTGFVGPNRCICLNEHLRLKSYEMLNALSNFSLSDFKDFSLSYYPDTPAEKRNLIPRQKMEEVFQYCKKYAASFSTASPSILMIGATGLGKTHLSLSIARVVIDKGYGVIYGSLPNLISQLEKEKFRPGTEETASLQNLQECDLLILDDLGTEFQTPFTTSTIYNLINTRLSKRLPTIINTNLTYKELEQQYTPRILSRISGAFDTLFFFGHDIRRLQKDERMNNQ